MVYLESFYFPSVEEEEEELQKIIENKEQKPAINYITEKAYPFTHRPLLKR